MYQCPDVSFFDYSGLDEQQREKINQILYRTENGTVILPSSHIATCAVPMLNSPPGGLPYPVHAAPLPTYAIQPPSMHSVIPSFPMVLRYPTASQTIVLNPYMPYQFHMSLPQTSGSLAMFVPPNHLIPPAPYHYPCPFPRDISSGYAQPVVDCPLVPRVPGATSGIGLNEANRSNEEGVRDDATNLKRRVKLSLACSTTKEVDCAITSNTSEDSSGVQMSNTSEDSGVQTSNTNEAPLVSENAGVQKPSWASLLRNTPSANNAIVITSQEGLVKIVSQNKSNNKTESRRNSDVLNQQQTSHFVNGDDGKTKLISLLNTHKISHKSPSLLPRGLTNRTNWCYVNATLQALVACPPFYHLVKSLTQFDSTMWDLLNLPVIKSLVKFVSEFETIQIKASEKFSSVKGMKEDIRRGIPFEPDFVYSMLQSIDHGAFKLNQQEDAEEFLSFILNNLHEEILKLNKVEVPTPATTNCQQQQQQQQQPQQQQQQQQQQEDNTWQQVRSKNRTAQSVNPASLEWTVVSEIFRGQICSTLQCQGQKDSSSLQPFFTLQLDVQSEKVKTVNDALDQFVSKECLLDYTCNQSKGEVDATQRTLIESLPPVLLLHLKWFVYNKDGGIQKNTKQFDLDVNLEITKDLLSSHAKSKWNQNQRRYKLFAVVNHIGHRAVGGHYTVDVFHAGYNTWLRCDDDNISPITQQQVLKFTHPNVPYLIFYRRIDAS